MAKFRKENLTDKSWVRSGKIPKILVPSENLMKRLWNLHPDKKPIVRIHGKNLTCPRWNESYLNSYAFSGQIALVNPNPDKYFVTLLWWINRQDPDNEHKFNQILVNWYENGNDYIGAHSDDEKQLIQGSEVVTISLGATRTFRIRPKHRGIVEWLKKDFEVKSGDVLIMGGSIQSQFTHEIVKINGEKGRNVGRRISVTLRKFK